jgi:hypothetical protein
MGAWVTTVLRALFHATDSPFSPSTPPMAEATQTGNAIAGGCHGH